mmetsp:Transcript_26756/g.65586  ORF Transcript_26756/g.65586 Transcript_26756/m.65586 type:complete len:307 (+) Transcript_26756:902-1822(+)
MGSLSVRRLLMQYMLWLLRLYSAVSTSTSSSHSLMMESSTRAGSVGTCTPLCGRAATAAAAVAAAAEALGLMTAPALMGEEKSYVSMAYLTLSSFALLLGDTPMAVANCCDATFDGGGSGGGGGGGDLLLLLLELADMLVVQAASAMAIWRRSSAFSARMRRSSSSAAAAAAASSIAAGARPRARSLRTRSAAPGAHCPYSSATRPTDPSTDVRMASSSAASTAVRTTSPTTGRPSAATSPRDITLSSPRASTRALLLMTVEPPSGVGRHVKSLTQPTDSARLTVGHPGKPTISADVTVTVSPVEE